MVRLLIIADDFTGALDTGVQMAAYGAPTRVITDPGAEWGTTGNTEVLVIDAETRHLPAKTAATAVRDIVLKAAASGIPHIYKKTDSALRGNIGAELTALLEASKEKELAFLPAYPQINRNTVGGIHFIGETPVAQSIFGSDPYDPVLHSRVSELIAAQSSLPVHTADAGTKALDQGPGIYVFDAKTPEDLNAAGESLAHMGKLHILAGCAGFGSVLPKLLHLKQERCTQKPVLDERLLVVCGSMNPITLAQMAEADKAGFAHWRLTPRQKLQAGYWQTEDSRQALTELLKILKENESVILDSNDPDGSQTTEQYATDHNMTPEEIRTGVSRSIGKIVSGLFDSEDLGTLLITGGDTLLQCMNEMGVAEMEPVCEMSPGVVLSRFRYKGRCRHVISKSGGFGDRTLLTDLKEMLKKARRTKE